MVYATFTDEMKQLLSNTKGECFVSFECEKDEAFSRAFGNMRLNFNTFSIDLTNEEHTLPFFDENEDITHFSCAAVDPKNPFKPAVVADTKVSPVDKTVTDIELITDTINVNNGEYEICFDAAIIIHMGDDVIMLARDTWFSELITIADNDNYDKIFSIDDVKEAWSNDGDYLVDVKRVRTKL